MHPSHSTIRLDRRHIISVHALMRQNRPRHNGQTVPQREPRTRDENGDLVDERDRVSEESDEAHRDQEHDDENHRDHSHTDDRNDVTERIEDRKSQAEQRKRRTQRTKKAMAMLNALGRHGGRMHRALGRSATKARGVVSSRHLVAIPATMMSSRALRRFPPLETLRQMPMAS